MPLHGIVQVDDACGGGERTGGKRGRGAAGKTPFVAAVQVTADGKPERMRMSSVAGFRKKTLAAWAGRHLQPGTEVHSDGPACFRGVADAGCERVPTVTGGGKRSCGDSRFVRANTMLANVKQSLAGTCIRSTASTCRGTSPSSATASTAATIRRRWSPACSTPPCAPRPCLTAS